MHMQNHVNSHWGTSGRSRRVPHPLQVSRLFRFDIKQIMKSSHVGRLEPPTGNPGSATDISREQ